MVNTIALFFGVLMVFALDLPYTPRVCPGRAGSTGVVNYTPAAIIIPLIFGGWYLSRRRTSTRARSARWRRTRSPGT